MRLKRRTIHGREVLAFTIRAYGDLAAADEALMALQVIVGPVGGFLEAAWTQKRNGRGWILRFRNT